MLPLQDEEVLSPRNPRRHHATGRLLRCCGAGVWVYWRGDTGSPGLEYALDCLHGMLQQHRAIGLQIDCMIMMAMPAPMVRLPASHVGIPYGPRLWVATL